MRTVIYRIVLIFCSLYLVSCYKDIDLEKFRPIPKVVINGVITTDTVVLASVTRTWFFTENVPNVNLKNAKVELYVDNIFRENMVWQEKKDTDGNVSGCFVSSVVPREGEVVKIVVTSEYGMAYVEDKIPMLTDIDLVEMTAKKESNPDDVRITVGPDGEVVVEQIKYYVIHYRVTFQDTPGQKNYYFIYIDEGPMHEWTYGSFDFSIDPIYDNHQTVLDGVLGFDDGGGSGCVFSDEKIEGRQYTFTVKESLDEMYVNMQEEEGEDKYKRRILLYSLSESYYRYLVALEKIYGGSVSGSLSDIGLAEPVKVYSNVCGGVGILGACQRAEKIVDIRNLIESTD